MNHPITLPQNMLKRLEKISTASRTTPDALIKSAISDRLDYEEWLLKKIDAGLADVKAGRVYSRDEAMSKLGIIKHARKKAA